MGPGRAPTVKFSAFGPEAVKERLDRAGGSVLVTTPSLLTKVNEIRGKLPSLQHVIVMRFVDEDGVVQGPVVQKHWRQDWTYEDTSIHAFQGEGVWVERAFDADEVSGRWSQAVYQVDDLKRQVTITVVAHRREVYRKK